MLWSYLSGMIILSKVRGTCFDLNLQILFFFLSLFFLKKTASVMWEVTDAVFVCVFPKLWERDTKGRNLSTIFSTFSGIPSALP